MEDVVRLTYKELFTIRMQHGTFDGPKGSLLFEKIKLAPDSQTRKILQQYNIGFRVFDNTLVCFIRSVPSAPSAREPQKPFVFFLDTMRFRFLINASTGFLAHTYVASAGSRTVYYFSNKTDNIQSGKRFISNKVEAFNLTKNYEAGTLVGDGGNLYTALKPVSAADVIPISNTSYWKRMNAIEQVVNNADLQPVSFIRPEISCFGVIDVYSDGLPNADYNLFNPAKEILSPVYTVNFKSKP